MQIHESSEIGRPSVSDGVIASVRILGAISANGRRYTRESMEGAIALYEGLGVNVDHRMGAREVKDRIGALKGVRLSGDHLGLSGDLHYLASHPVAPILKESAERLPEALGFSHVIEAEFGESKQVVSKIVKVHSVDLVADPATTSSLFEQHDPPEPPDDRMDEATVRSRLFGFSEEVIQMVLTAPRPIQETVLEELARGRPRPASFSPIVFSQPARSEPSDSWPKDFLKEVRR